MTPERSTGRPASAPHQPAAAAAACTAPRAMPPAGASHTPPRAAASPRGLSSGEALIRGGPAGALHRRARPAAEEREPPGGGRPPRAPDPGGGRGRGGDQKLPPPPGERGGGKRQSHDSPARRPHLPAAPATARAVPAPRAPIGRPHACPRAPIGRATALPRAALFHWFKGVPAPRDGSRPLATTTLLRRSEADTDSGGGGRLRPKHAGSRLPPASAPHVLGAVRSPPPSDGVS